MKPKVCKNCQYFTGKEDVQWYCTKHDSVFAGNREEWVSCIYFKSNLLPDTFFEICLKCKQCGEYGDSRNPKYACYIDKHDIIYPIHTPKCLTHVINCNNLTKYQQDILKNSLKQIRKLEEKLKKIQNIL